MVEQSFVVVRQENGRLGLVYGSPSAPIPTTENGQAVPVPYSMLDGEVTIAAAPPWDDTPLERSFTVLSGVGRGSAGQLTMFAVVPDPLMYEMGCEAARLRPIPRRSSGASGPTPTSRRPLRWLWASGRSTPCGWT